MKYSKSNFVILISLQKNRYDRVRTAVKVEDMNKRLTKSTIHCKSKCRGKTVSLHLIMLSSFTLLFQESDLKESETQLKLQIEEMTQFVEDQKVGLNRVRKIF